MRKAESVPPDQFVEVNTFYLNQGTQLPPLAPQAYFTYAKDESIHQVLADIHNHLGAAAELEGVALWIRPPPPPPLPGAAMDLDASDSSEDDEASANAAIEEAEPATEDPGAPAVPLHPDAGPLDPLQDHLVLPPDLQTQLQIQLNCVLDPIIAYYEDQGRTPELALNEARSRAWAHLRDMTEISFRATLLIIHTHTTRCVCGFSFSMSYGRARWGSPPGGHAGASTRP